MELVRRAGTSTPDILVDQDVLTVAAGKHLKIETSPAGVDVLDAVVPEGKQWNVTITVHVVETDAA